MRLFQKNSTPKKSSIRQIYKLYKLNKDVGTTDIFATMDILYSKLPTDMTLNEAIQLYSYGLSYVGFPAFRKFMMESTHANH